VERTVLPSDVAIREAVEAALRHLDASPLRAVKEVGDERQPSVVVVRGGFLEGWDAGSTTQPLRRLVGAGDPHERAASGGPQVIAERRSS
jgi:hypothetical protein